MLSSRVTATLLRHGFRGSITVSRARMLSSAPTASVPETTLPPHDDKMHPDLDDSEKNSVQVYTNTMRERDGNMVYLTEMPPDPVLPANPEEISALDPAQKESPKESTWAGKRTVVIRQEQKNVSQSPSTKEKHWVISFTDDGAIAETWSNPLMGWVSGADAMASNIGLQMQFKSAKDAVYFAKKRGWKYEVEKPIMRIMRIDGAAYQDNFLPQPVALEVRKKGAKCDHWHRPAAGTSHYFRPLKYHGDGLVPQHGPNGDAPVAPDAESYYKTR